MSATMLVEGCEEELERFSKMHSWYKKLKFYGQYLFYVIPVSGATKNMIVKSDVRENTVYDENKNYWVILDYIQIKNEKISQELRDISTSYPLVFNPILGGMNKTSEGKVYRTDFAFMKGSNRNDFPKWIEENYPGFKVTRHKDELKLYVMQYKKYLQQLTNATEQIWKQVNEKNVDVWVLNE